LVTTTNSTILPLGTTPADNCNPSIPQQIGEFAILKKLGEGAYGQVFLASQTSLGRQVALKITRGEETGRNEGQLLAGLEHDHIVKVFSEFSDLSTGTHGLCLQYIPGTNLGEVIQHIHANGRVPDCGKDILAVLDAHRHGETSFDPAALRDRDALSGETFAQAVCRLGARLAEALAFAHIKRILHCDIKPANILLTPYGRPMLADFNVAFDRTRHRASDGIGGTMAYTAPEHAAALRGVLGGRVDERCDVYSLGVVLQELGTGERPEPCDPFIERVQFEVTKKPNPLDRLPRELAMVIRRCLNADPARRYQTAEELANALMGAWHLLAAQRTIPAPGRIGNWVNAHPVVALALAACLPHLAASVVNIGYNSVEIRLTLAQQQAFAVLVMSYNLLAYPLLLGIVGLYLWRLQRQLAGLTWASWSQLDETRNGVRRWGWRTLVLGAVGWFPGGLLFPLVIDLAADPVPWQTYIHFAISFTLAGLIGVVFCYLATEYVVFRALLPRLCDPDHYTRGEIWSEFGPLTAPYAPFLVLACAVPLTGAVLLIASTDGMLTLGFRLLVTGLIGLGVVGVGIAERLTRELRSLAAVWQRETAKPTA
jgi:serine/threonine protein kinase